MVPLTPFEWQGSTPFEGPPEAAEYQWLGQRSRSRPLAKEFWLPEPLELDGTHPLRRTPTRRVHQWNPVLEEADSSRYNGRPCPIGSLLPLPLRAERA